MANERVRHMVVFTLKHNPKSPETQRFLTHSKAVLAPIPGVENFEVLNQISQKNDYDFGFSMEFTNQAAYDAYSNHPIHVEYVQQHWMKEVADFMEIDFKTAAI